jgi:hypothetical protein
MTTKQLLQRLDKWIGVIRKSFLALKLFEVLAVAAIGYATNRATAENALPVWTGILAAGIIFYAIISLIQTAYSYYFPSNVVDELDARLELDTIRKKLNRKSEIYDYLTDAIGDLNNQTCHISGGSTDHLCENGIKDNITNVVSPLFTNTNYLFESTKTSYTIGIYLNNYYAKPETEVAPIDIDNLEQRGIIILKDDWNFADGLDKNLMADGRASGFRQQIKQAIETSLNNDCYYSTLISTDQSNFRIFAIEVQEVCEDRVPRGVLFIITEEIKEPEDIEQILRLFSKIISNLLSRQDECIYNQVEKKNQAYREALRQTPAQKPPEVDALERENRMIKPISQELE